MSAPRAWADSSSRGPPWRSHSARSRPARWPETQEGGASMDTQSNRSETILLGTLLTTLLGGGLLVALLLAVALAPFAPLLAAAAGGAGGAGPGGPVLSAWARSLAPRPT